METFSLMIVKKMRYTGNTLDLAKLKNAGMDKYGKAAYALMYKNKSSQNGEDFLLRLNFLLNEKIPRVGHDNGSKFEKYFKTACKKSDIKQYYSDAQKQSQQ